MTEPLPPMSDVATPPPADGTWAYTARTFNRICYAVALVWIFGSLAVNLRLHPLVEADRREYHDFSQFYMGGVVAKDKAWDDLYPIPKPDSLNSPGAYEYSDMRPRYAELARQAGVRPDTSRFIQPPPFALMMQPLAYLKYRWAKWAWLGLMGLCTWGVAIAAGRAYEWCAGRRSRVGGLVALLVALSPLALDAQLLLNVSPLIALLIAWSILGLMHRHSEGGSLALVIGAAAKYATAVLVPLYLAMSKWRAIAVMVVLAAGVIAGTYAVTGKGPFIEFGQLAKTFNRVHTDEWNRALPSILIRLRHEEGQPIHGASKIIWQVLQWLTLAGVLVVLWTRSREFWRSAPNVFAGAAALLSWFLIFSPLTWDHYFLYLMPVWGWLVWEARQSWLKGIVVVAIVGYQWVPSSVLDHVRDRLHARSTKLELAMDAAMLVVAALVFLLAAVRLLTPVRETEAEQVETREYAATPRQFNRLCYAVAALWLLFVVPYSLHERTMYKADYPQFYMGGVMARLKAWDALYPVPHPGSHNNPGMETDSDMRPRYAEQAEQRGVGNRVRFIQPPPVALLLLPLGYLGYERSFQVWTLLLIACGWGVGVVAGKTYATMRGRPSKGQGLIALLVVISPLMLHAIRIANMTVPVGLFFGIATLGLVRRWNAASGLATVLGGVTKYVTLALLPLAIAMRRWGMVLWTALFAAAIFGGTYALTKAEPFKTYGKEISPTLARTHDIETNQSIPAFLGRVLHQQELPKNVRIAVLVGEAVVFLVVLFVIFRKPVVAWSDPGNSYAGATALLCAMLIFAPTFWEHYPVYLCPLWGWMVWEGWRSKAKLPLAVLGIAATYVPWTYLIDQPMLREPWNTHILIGTLLLLVMALWKLLETTVAVTAPVVAAAPVVEERFAVAEPPVVAAVERPQMPLYPIGEVDAPPAHVAERPAVAESEPVRDEAPFAVAPPVASEPLASESPAVADGTVVYDEPQPPVELTPPAQYGVVREDHEGVEPPADVREPERPHDPEPR